MPSSFTASGDFALAIETLVAAWAESTAFQNIVGAANATAARKFIAKHEGQDPATDEVRQTLPRAIVSKPPNSNSWERDGTGNWPYRFTLNVALELPVVPVSNGYQIQNMSEGATPASQYPAEHSEGIPDEMTQCDNLVSLVIEDLKANLAEVTGCARFGIAWGPGRSDVRFNGQLYYAVDMFFEFEG